MSWVSDPTWDIFINRTLLTSTKPPTTTTPANTTPDIVTAPVIDPVQVSLWLSKKEEEDSPSLSLPTVKKSSFCGAFLDFGRKWVCRVCI